MKVHTARLARGRRVVLALTAALAAIPAAPCPAVDLDVGRLEAAVYSLPNVRAFVEAGIEEDSFVVSEFADPVLAFPWKQLDHSAGINATCQVTVRLWEDASFPLGEAPEWKEVVDRTVVLENRHRTRQEATFNREGRIRLPVHLDHATPVRRLKMELVSKVTSPFFTDVKRSERPFFLTLRPRWKSREHHHPALMQMIALAYRRKLAAWRWKTYLRQVALASRSLKDARRFLAERQARRMLEETNRLASDALDDDVLEQVTEDFLAESGKAMGRLRDGIDSLSQELLGVHRLAFTYMEAAEHAWTQAREAVSEQEASRNFVVAFRASGQAMGVRESLDRVLFHLDRELEVLTHLWYISSDAELALLLSRYEEALRLEDQEMVDLGRKLEAELGRDYTAHDWLPVGASALYRERFDKDDPSRSANAQLLRAVWFGLYYLIRTEHFNVGVLAAAARRAREGVDVQAPKARLLPAFEDENLPPHLRVAVGVNAMRIRPGGLAQYPIAVRNVDRQPREVHLREVSPLPSGWFSGFSEREFTLQPGEEKQVVYTITSPFYLGGSQEVRSGVRIYFGDEAARYHEPVFTTLAAVDTAPVAATDLSSHLEIEVLASERTMRPGEVAKYTYLVTHHGPTKKLVTCELLNDPPEGWIAVLDPARLWLEPGEQARVDLRVTAPLYLDEADRQEWIVGIAYSEEFENKERIAFTTLATNLHAVKAEPVLNGDVVRTYFLRPGESVQQMLVMQNKGNVKDTFDFFVEAPPEGWYLRLGQQFVDLPAFSEPTQIPLRVQAPANAQAGDHVEVPVTVVSATRPEIRHTNRIRLAIVGDPDLHLLVEGAPYQVAPGDELVFTLLAENRSEGSMKLGFRPASGIPRPGWIRLEGAVEELGPGATRRIQGRIRPPESEQIGDPVEFAVAAVNDLGEEVAHVPFEVLLARRHAVDLVLDDSRTLTSKGLVAVKLIVSNLGTVEDTIQLILSGLKRRYWARLSHPRVRLAPGEQREVSLLIRVPPRTDPGQEAVVEVQAKSARDSKARDWVSVTVEPQRRPRE